MPEPSDYATRPRATDSGIRLAELMAALSIATDLGMGQPLETALCSCVVAMRLGEALNLDDDTLRDVYYQALLRYIGCNAETSTLAALVGDELALRRDFAAVDPGEPGEVVNLVVRYLQQANAGEPPSRMDEIVARSLIALPRLTQESFAGHCEVAQRLAGRLGLADSLIVCLGQLYERWDGKGLPGGLKGEEVSPPVLLVTLAQDAVIWARMGGPDAAVAMVRKRSGGAYHPQMAQRFCEQAPALLAGLDQEPTWESVLALEPGSRQRLTEEEFDRACEALADFVDIKSSYTLGHSPDVAALAAGAGRRSGLVEEDVSALRRAGLLHDIGSVGISAGIWGKKAPLSEREWEQVRLHAYYTDRVLARPERLARLGALASQHHERLDGSGYHRALRGQALSPEEAAKELGREARAGRLDGDAVRAVLAEAGHRVPPVRRERPAGLSRREVEVLRLLVRGLSNRDMAEQLYLSPDTVKHHIQHIYDKTGLSTRAGATMFAMEHSLL